MSVRFNRLFLDSYDLKILVRLIQVFMVVPNMSCQFLRRTIRDPYLDGFVVLFCYFGFFLNVGEVPFEQTT